MDHAAHCHRFPVALCLAAPLTANCLALPVARLPPLAASPRPPSLAQASSRMNSTDHQRVLLGVLPLLYFNRTHGMRADKQQGENQDESTKKKLNLPLKLKEITPNMLRNNNRSTNATWIYFVEQESKSNYQLVLQNKNSNTNSFAKHLVLSCSFLHPKNPRN